MFIFNSKQEMFDKEAEIVTEEFITTSNTYNIKPGGSGGNPGIIGAFSGRRHSTETKEKIRNAALQQITTDRKRNNISKNHWSKHNPSAHREHMKKISSYPRTLDHSKKIAEANIGKILINNGFVAKRIDKQELTYYETIGWKKGGMPHKK